MSMSFYYTHCLCQQTQVIIACLEINAARNKAITLVEKNKAYSDLSGFKKSFPVIFRKESHASETGVYIRKCLATASTIQYV